jgi:hypothetical protein
MEIGIKGSDVYNASSIGDSLLALSCLLTRGADEMTIKKMVNEILSDPLQEVLEDLIVLAFQTRDIRGGKGERDLSRYIFEVLLNHPEHFKLMLTLLDLIPEYGCWQDLFKLIPNTPANTLFMLENIIKYQIDEDENALEIRRNSTWGGEELPKISLLAKWMPREGDKFANEMATLLVPGSMFHATRMKLYRKKISALNKAINTVEIKMCGKEWSSIVPNTVPGRALNNYLNAFLNKKLLKGKVSHTLLRHPADKDRMDCREHFKQHYSEMENGKVLAKGADTLFPHEIIKRAMNILEESCNCQCDSDITCDTHTECQYLNGVWTSMVEAAKEGGGLGRSLAMCDFSGSMRSRENGGTPYWVSMALGLLISEVTTDEFKNTFLTFDSNPRFHLLPDTKDLFTKLRSFDTRIMGQGTSTDFQKAMDLVLQQCKASRVKPGEEPERLIVLTDMAWDQACGSSEQSGYTGNRYRHVVKTDDWQTHIEMIRESFKRAGEDMWGVAWKMPTIVIWNIASTCQDFHATATAPGVVMLSGWSPSLFKVLQTEGAISPHKALHAQLDNERYDPVRVRIGEFYCKQRAMSLRTPSKTSLVDLS